MANENKLPEPSGEPSGLGTPMILTESDLPGLSSLQIGTGRTDVTVYTTTWISGLTPGEKGIKITYVLIADKNGNIIADKNGNPIGLFALVDGKDPSQLSKKELEEIGRNLHNLSEQFADGNTAGLESSKLSIKTGWTVRDIVKYLLEMGIIGGGRYSILTGSIIAELLEQLEKGLSKQLEKLGPDTQKTGLLPA